MMSWAVFWVNPQNLSPQLQLAGTSMLTLIAYQFTVNDLLPRVGYLTSMDQYVLSSSLLVFLALVEALITGRLASTGRAAAAEMLDRVSRWLFPVTYVTIIFVTLW
jgi:cadmium resistance protein CadD (predicted permease)